LGTVGENMKLSDLKESGPGGSIDWDAQPIEKQLIMVKADPWSIELISDPDEELQLVAVRLDPEAVQFIENPTISVQRLVIAGNPWNIDYINNPSPAIVIEVLKNPQVFADEFYYSTYVKRYFANNTLLMKKWLRYGDLMRTRT
jgi:hypothetical protein